MGSGSSGLRFSGCNLVHPMCFLFIGSRLGLRSFRLPPSGRHPCPWLMVPAAEHIAASSPLRCRGTQKQKSHVPRGFWAIPDSFGTYYSRHSKAQACLPPSLSKTHLFTPRIPSYRTIRMLKQIR